MTIAAVAAGTPERSVTSLRRAVAAGSIGNALEWYDLTVSFYFSVILAKLFFPRLGDTAGLLTTLGTFGATYLVRPLGAVVLGAYADRAGRKASLMASILLMMIGTFLTAIMPTYATIGVLAPLGILAARLTQGFSVGGEFGSATAFLVERAPDRRGFLASWQWSSQGMSAMLGTGFGVLLTSTLTEAQLESWGWRVPFFFGLLIGPIGLYIRRHIDETPEFLETKKTATPVRELLERQWDRVLLAVGAVALSSSVNYLIVYMPTYAIKELKLPASTGLIAGFVAATLLTVFAPVIGHWSDKVGRCTIMRWVTALVFVSILPALYFLNASPSLPSMLAVLAWIGLLKAGYSGALPAFLAELFPTQTRGTGMSLSYNLSVPLFGGFAPAISQGLIELTGSKLAPSGYIMATSVLSVAALTIARRRLGLR